MMPRPQAKDSGTAGTLREQDLGIFGLLCLVSEVYGPASEQNPGFRFGTTLPEAF